MSHPQPEGKKPRLIAEVMAGRAAPASDRMASDVTAYLISGPALFGFLGWLLGGQIGAQRLLILLGILLGMTLSMYLVWLRYGMPETSQTTVPAERRGASLESERPTGPTDRSTKENL